MPVEKAQRTYLSYKYPGKFNANYKERKSH